MKLLMTIGPLGGEAKFKLYEEEDEIQVPFAYTHGEGQAFIFYLEDYDSSTEFAAAVEDGRFVRDFNAGQFKLGLR